MQGWDKAELQNIAIWFAGAAGRLHTDAEALSTGKRQAVCACRVVAVENGAETLRALAQGTILRMG